MATTSLWHIKGRLKDLIDYVENPEKTVSKDKYLQDFSFSVVQIHIQTFLSIFKQDVI